MQITDNQIKAIQTQVQSRTISLPDGTTLPSLGQGTWHMGDDPAREADEIQALQLGLKLGLRVVDTAEMYGNGRAETVTAKALQHFRNEAFLVSKVLPSNAGRKNLQASLENSLSRLQTDYLDLYLLHWRGGVPLQETVEEMEKMKAQGLIKRWGVSNFDTADMQELNDVTGGQSCAVNQVLYHLGSRGIEYSLLPSMRKRAVPAMAYCPLAQGGNLRSQLLTNPSVQKVADSHQITPMQLLLAWSIRSGDVLSIPKAGREEHVLQNAQAAGIELTPEDLTLLDEAFPPPSRKEPLDIV